MFFCIDVTITAYVYTTCIKIIYVNARSNKNEEYIYIKLVRQNINMAGFNNKQRKQKKGIKKRNILF